MKLGESYCNLICKCGHEADYDEFCRTPIRGELPKGHHQCPRCHRAWTLVTKGKATLGWSGMVLPPDLVVEPISPSL